MKNLFKKNQIIITTLAVMIAIAGYLNYSGALPSDGKLAKEANADVTVNDVDASDISDEDLYVETQKTITTAAANTGSEEEANEASSGDIESLDVDMESIDTEGSIKNDSTPGEAVLTTSNDLGVIEQARITREQTRAKNKETLLEIINNTNIADTQKQEAIQNMMNLTDIAEKEASIETLLEAKGFTDIVVSIQNDTVDVVVNMNQVDDAKRAQIEDIVKRKTGLMGDKIVITPVTVQKN